MKQYRKVFLQISLFFIGFIIYSFSQETPLEKDYPNAPKDVKIARSYSACPDVPESCDTNLITFHLFNRNHPDGTKLSIHGEASNNIAELYTNGQIKLIFHGYTGGIQNSRMIQLREAYINDKHPDINILHVDYTELAQSGCYWILLRSLNIIGACTAEFIKNEMSRNEIAIDRFHLIGFSFGAHAAAVTSENIRDVGTFGRISGIEPALPFFVFPFPFASHKLNQNHAKFVDAIHTNAGIRGVLSSNAHFDFYANNGMKQNGCGLFDTLCSHARGLDIFIESVNSEVGFYAVKCSLMNIFLGRCQFDSSLEAILVACSNKTETPYHLSLSYYSAATKVNTIFQRMKSPNLPWVNLLHNQSMESKTDAVLPYATAILRYLV